MSTASARLAPLEPDLLHPALWLGHQLGRTRGDAVGTGFPPLDRELPGHGWPRAALTELLLAHPGVGEMRLMAPALVATQRLDRLVMLFDPPADLCADALAAMGLDVDALLVVHTRAGPGAEKAGEGLWAVEQALKSGHVGAVVAWLPRQPTSAERLRRLQLAASRHDGPAFVLREPAVAGRPSPAPLRLLLQPGGADRLRLQILKRRGPPLETPLGLELQPVLSTLARQRADDAEAAEAARGDSASHVPPRLHPATFVHVGRA